MSWYLKLYIITKTKKDMKYQYTLQSFNVVCCLLEADSRSQVTGEPVVVIDIFRLKKYYILVDFLN